MANFCKQCSLYMFGPGYNDFENIGKGKPPLKKGYGYPVLCEDCGPILVNADGECITKDCLKNHGDQTIIGFG